MHPIYHYLSFLFNPLIYLLFLLFLLIPAALWILYNGDPSGVYYVYLILALFLLTAATVYCIVR